MACAIDLRDRDVGAFEVVVAQHVDGDGLVVAGRRRVGHVHFRRDSTVTVVVVLPPCRRPRSP
jgi:hypothetical protein